MRQIYYAPLVETRGRRRAKYTGHYLNRQATAPDGVAIVKNNTGTRHAAWEMRKGVYECLCGLEATSRTSTLLRRAYNWESVSLGVNCQTCMRYIDRKLREENEE